MRVIRHISPAQKRWERAEERKAVAEFRAMSPEERQRMLAALRRMTRRQKRHQLSIDLGWGDAGAERERRIREEYERTNEGESLTQWIIGKLVGVGEHGNGTD